jgi:hypothetical protein
MLTLPNSDQIGRTFIECKHLGKGNQEPIRIDPDFWGARIGRPVGAIYYVFLAEHGFAPDNAAVIYNKTITRPGDDYPGVFAIPKGLSPILLIATLKDWWR